MNATSIVLLVLGILLAQVLIWVPLVLWLRRRMARLSDEVRDELAARDVVLGPHEAIYRGASGGDSSKVKGNGVAVLTEDRLVLAKLMGERVEIPLSELTGLREDEWFLRSYRSGRSHVIVKRGDGAELGFIVREHREWMDALRERVGGEGRRP